MKEVKRSSVVNKIFYADKRVFMTGHTGFKGAWLTALLHLLKAQARGYALAQEPGSLFEEISGTEMVDSVIGDVRDYDKLNAVLCLFKPEIVIHMAALLPIQACFDNPKYAYETNVMGTVNLFEAIRNCESVKSVVIVTTDKVYENRGDGALYSESDALGGIDPYSSSKTCMEYITDSYKRSYLQTADRMVGVSTVRASNVLAGGDHIKTRLIPSILNSIASGNPVELRYPHQTRPWQSMLDALNGYLTVARLMYDEPEKYSSQWNIGPTKDGIREVLWVVRKLQEFYEDSTGYLLVENESKVFESGTLGLDISKALGNLNWEPELSCAEMLSEIVGFFKGQLSGINERELCFKQIKNFYQID